MKGSNNCVNIYMKVESIQITETAFLDNVKPSTVAVGIEPTTLATTWPDV